MAEAEVTKTVERAAIYERGNAVMQPTNPPALLERAINSGVSVEVVEKLLALQERWEAAQARKAFEFALADLRKDLPTITKNHKVDFTTSKGRTNYNYEDLSAITEVLSPLMAARGLSFRWRTQCSGDVVIVICVVSHEQGHSEETTLSAKHDHSGNKNDIQAIGSAVTYLQRYTLKAALGVAAAEDDDGVAAGPRREDAPRAVATQQAPRPAPVQSSATGPNIVPNPIVGMVQDVLNQKGPNNAKGEPSWVRIGVIIAGHTFSTFDRKIEELAEKAAKEGKQVRIAWEKKELKAGKVAYNIEDMSVIEFDTTGEHQDNEEVPF